MTPAAAEPTAACCAAVGAGTHASEASEASDRVPHSVK